MKRILLIGLIALFAFVGVCTTCTAAIVIFSDSEEPSPQSVETSTPEATTTPAPPTATPEPSPFVGHITISPTSNGTENLDVGIQYGALLETDGPLADVGFCFASFVAGAPPVADRIVGYREIAETTTLRIPEDGLLEGEFEPIWKFNTQLCQPWRVVEAGTASGGSEEQVMVEGELMFESVATAVAEVEERKKGFHCLSPWDGNHDGLEALIRDNLNDPRSMETLATRITPVDEDGYHTVLLEFTAENTFGGRVRLTGHGLVDSETCTATLLGIE